MLGRLVVGNYVLSFFSMVVISASVSLLTAVDNFHKILVVLVGSHRKKKKGQVCKRRPITPTDQATLHVCSGTKGPLRTGDQPDAKNVSREQGEMLFCHLHGYYKNSGS